LAIVVITNGNVLQESLSDSDRVFTHATIVAVRRDDDEMSVMLELDPEADDDGREFRPHVLVVFAGVEDVLLVRPEGMIVTGLVETETLSNAQRYVFTNWYRFDPLLPKVERRLAEARLEVDAREVRVELLDSAVSDSIVRELTRQVRRARKAYDMTAIVVFAGGALLNQLGSRLGERAGVDPRSLLFGSLLLYAVSFAMFGVSRLWLRERRAIHTGVALLLGAGMWSALAAWSLF
jgi:hypothetical protein